MQNINTSHLIHGLPDSQPTPSPTTARSAAMPAVRLKQIALPTEHGGWGLLLEPIAAALAVAFSVGGLFIGIMAIGAFLVRQPLKVLVLDRMGMRVDERAKAAILFVLGFGSIFVLGLAGSFAFAGLRPLTPFGAVLPLAAILIYFDFARKSRNLLPELGGAIAISASAAAVALAGGFSVANSLGLWAILVARLVPSILYVRERLLEEKGKTFSRTIPLAAHFGALALVAALAYFGLSPIPAVLAMVMLLVRAAEGLSAGRRKMKVMKIGVLEVIYGTLTVVFIVAGHYSGI
jgi:hypothetical protein